MSFTKESVVRNTKDFIGIVIYVSFFSGIFGQTESLVGVSAVIAGMMLLYVDLQNDFWKYSAQVLFFFVFQGIATHIATFDPWLGLMVNFVALIILGYSFAHNLFTTVYIAYGFNYFFCYYSPVPNGQFGNRMVGILVACISIVLLQILCNKTITMKQVRASFGPQMKELYERGVSYARNFTLDSKRLNFGLKLAILGASSIFIAEYFQLISGKWLSFTVFSLTQVNYMKSREKSFKRIKGTLIGLALCGVIFLVVPDSAYFTIIVMFFGYINGYLKDYANLMMAVTVCAVTAAAMSGMPFTFMVDRLFLVTIGTMMALGLSKVMDGETVEARTTTMGLEQA